MKSTADRAVYRKKGTKKEEDDLLVFSLKKTNAASFRIICIARPSHLLLVHLNSLNMKRISHTINNQHDKGVK